LRAVKYPLHWLTVLFSLCTDNTLCSLSAQTILMDFRDLAHHAFVLANFFKFEKNNVDFDRKQTRDSVWQNKKNKNFMAWKNILRKQSQSLLLYSTLWKYWILSNFYQCFSTENRQFQLIFTRRFRCPRQIKRRR